MNDATTTVTTDTAYQSAVLDTALTAIGEMMILPLADAEEVADATQALRHTVAQALAQTAPSEDEGLNARRAQMQQIERAIDDLPEEADEAAMAIWDIAKDAFRATRRRAANERLRSAQEATSEEMA